MKITLYGILTVVILNLTSYNAKAQRFLKQLEKAASSVANSTVISGDNKSNNTSNNNNTTTATNNNHNSSTTTNNNNNSSNNNTINNTAAPVESKNTLSDFHQKNIRKILFSKSQENLDMPQLVNTVDLKQPYYINAYFENSLAEIKAERQPSEEYNQETPFIIRNYFINNELIASYNDVITQEQFSQTSAISDVLVPENENEFKANEFRMGVLSHVFSSLQPGTHRFKIEYQLNISTKKPQGNGSAAYIYENVPFTVATGEVDIAINASDLTTYCKNYGRPKFEKGIIHNEPQLEKQIAGIIKANRGKEPVYVYADDNWVLKRDALNRVLSREAQIYYIFTNDKGRCEMANFPIVQTFDGKSYYPPKEGFNKRGVGFKFASCQNY